MPSAPTLSPLRLAGRAVLIFAVAVLSAGPVAVVAYSTWLLLDVGASWMLVAAGLAAVVGGTVVVTDEIRTWARKQLREV